MKKKKLLRYMTLFVLLVALSPLAYYGYGRFEQWRERRAAFERLRIFGGRIMSDMRRKNLYELQSSFTPEAARRLGLEDIALFITTMEIDRSRDEVWSDWNETERNASLSGVLNVDERRSYPLRLMMTKGPEGISLRWIEVNDKRLMEKEERFPIGWDRNVSDAEANVTGAR